MTTSRTTSINAPKSGRRSTTRNANEESKEGDDAGGGDPETGLDTSDISLEGQEDEADGQAGLSLDAEDLGPRMLQNAMQNDGFSHGESVALGSDLSEPGGLDLTSNVIDEGSLFDQPRDENGGTRRPQIRTNEVDATLERNQRANRERLKRSARRH